MKNSRMIFVFSVLISVQGLDAEDHRDHLEGPFETVHEVTETCLMCHEDAGQSFMQSIHWTWGKGQDLAGQDRSAVIGKRTVLNNFCIGLKGNEPRCTSCHAGYGWKDDSFDFSDPLNIDCLVCHEHTGTYRKFPTAAGYPLEKRIESPKASGSYENPPDLLRIAQSVGGKPTRQACGNCHFYGGGGNNVKHGDLEAALIHPSRELDVHMGGADMACVDCHETSDHEIPGNAMSVSTHSTRSLSCSSCHGEEPHTKYAYYLNKHAQTLACQTCHIPEFAREHPTKMRWDWSQAGDTKRAVQKDANGMPDYDPKKGAFTWGKDIVPVYAWYNGSSRRMLLGDAVTLTGTNTLSAPLGSKTDPEARIYPFKVHTGQQIADKKHKYLLPTHLYGGGYWDHLNWDKAVSAGARMNGIVYSGSTCFVETEMYWEIDHMVAPKEAALMCSACHSQVRQTHMPWTQLGYASDPRYTRGLSRTKMHP